MPVSTSHYDAKLEDARYNGWDVFSLSNGLIELLLAPNLGGRAIQLRLGQHEFFWVNKDLAGKVVPAEGNDLGKGSANYGGDKVWPAPQGWLSDDEWPGPPYYVLDGSRYASQVVKRNSEEVAVRVSSPADKRTGIQFRRTFHVYAGTTRIKVKQAMWNISRRRVRWGIWHVTQHDGADRNGPAKPNPDLSCYAPLNARSRFPRGYCAMFGDARHPSYEVIEDGKMLRVRYLYRVGKIAADSDGGWCAVVNGQQNTCFVENFEYFHGADYPDGATFEAWKYGPGTIRLGAIDRTLPDDPKVTPYCLESEILSPLVTLEPGEAYAFPVSWAVTRAPNPIRGSVWAGVISEPLTATVGDGCVTLRGTFGVFTPGIAEAGLYSAAGEELARRDLQGVDPRQVFRLEQAIPVPAEAFRVSVLVRDVEGENCGFLGNTILR